MGLTLTEVEKMPYYKLFKLLQARRAVEAEKTIEDLRVASAPKLLESKTTSKNYTKIFNNLKKVISKFGHKEVTVEADLESIKNRLQGR